MKYPTEICIRGHYYRIEYVKDVREVAQDFESDNYLGTCNPKVIRIHADQPSIIILDTLIHEILHSIFTRNMMLKTAFRRNIEEQFISTLASDIAYILLDNGLVKLPKQPPITVRIIGE